MSGRYQRHSLIDWFDQNKVREACIIVVGAGAVGNEVLKNLSLLGVGHIFVLDFDKIEDHNLTRCVLFTESDIGGYKAEVAAQSCRKIDPNIEIGASCSDFWDGLSLEQVAKADALVCCVDNFEARIRLNQLCLLTGTDFYNTGIDSRYAAVEVFPFATDPECACFECALPPSAYISMQKRYSCGWLKKVAFEERKIPTTSVTSSFAGAAVVSMMLNRINEHPQAIQGAVRHFQDTITLETTTSTIQKKSDCMACLSVDSNSSRSSAKRFCSMESHIPLGVRDAGEIVLSEPVLIDGICKLCGRRQEHFESVRKLNDAVTFCSICGQHSIATEIVQRMTFSDFKKYFAGKSLPCKFIMLNSDNQQIVIEMED